jgi:hypothetical protein
MRRLVTDCQRLASEAGGGCSGSSNTAAELISIQIELDGRQTANP